MSVKPRPYQTEALAAIRDAARDAVMHQIVALPTGTGKTVVFAMLAKQVVERDRRVLIIAHRDELLEQAAHKLAQVEPSLADKIGFVRAGQDETDRQVVIASVQTISRQRRLDRLTPDFSLMVVDEAHHSAADSYLRIIDAMDHPQMLRVGMTATPQRSDKKDLRDRWDKVVYHKGLVWMIREGYLCNMRGVQIRLKGFDVSNLKVRAGDFTDESSARALEYANAPDHAAAAWHEHAEGRPTLVFTPTVELSQHMAAAFVRSGVAAEHLDGTTPSDERKAILARLRTGETKVVSNVAVLTEGFDEPSVSCIIMARPTKSKPLYVQIVGRGSRLWPNKADCLVMDMVGVTDRHDLITMPLLFGLASTAAQLALGGEGGLLGALAREEQLKATWRESTEIDLFSGHKRMTWIIENGVWSLSLGRDKWVAVEREPSGIEFSVATYDDVGPTEVLGEHLDFGYAVGVAEDRARKEAVHLVDPNAGWRQRQASLKQLNLLVAKHVPHGYGITSGEASDLIAAYFAHKAPFARKDGTR